MSIYATLAHLPAFAHGQALVATLNDASVLLVQGDAGSGRTLLIPTILADAWAERRVLVLTPNRLLAVSTARKLAALTQTPLGEFFGYAVGRRGEDLTQPEIGLTTARVVFTTYGAAIAQGHIDAFDTVVFDEAGVRSEEAEVVRAVLRRRLVLGDTQLKVVLLHNLDAVPASAVAFWTIAAVAPAQLTLTGTTHDAHLTTVRPYGGAEASEMVDQALMLVSAHHRRGVLVFVENTEAVASITKTLRTQAAHLGLDVEVVPVTGRHTMRELEEAVAPPPDGQAKILVGTSLLESGLDLPWVTGVVTNGKGVEYALVPDRGMTSRPVALSRERLFQQASRSSRYRPGVVILVSHTPVADRPPTDDSSFARLSPETVVIKCAMLGRRAAELTFDGAFAQVDIEAADRNLQVRGLLDVTGTLTPAGALASTLAISPEGAAMLAAGQRRGCLAAVLPLVAIYETGSLKANQRRPFLLNQRSDLIDEAMAYALAVGQLAVHVQETARTREFSGLNVVEARLRDAKARLEQLEVGTHTKADVARFDHTLDRQLEDDLVHCILAGFFPQLQYYRVARDRASAIPLGVGDVLDFAYGTLAHTAKPDWALFATGKRRLITQREGAPFVVLEMTTLYSEYDVVSFLKARPDLLSAEADRQELVVRSAVTNTPVFSMPLLNDEMAKRWGVKPVAAPLAPPPAVAVPATSPAPTPEADAPSAPVNDSEQMSATLRSLQERFSSGHR